MISRRPLPSVAFAVLALILNPVAQTFAYLGVSRVDLRKYRILELETGIFSPKVGLELTNPEIKSFLL